MGLRLWSLLGVAFFGWAFITSLHARRGGMRIVQIILLAAALVSVRPLQDWAFGATTVQTQAHLNFADYDSRCVKSGAGRGKRKTGNAGSLRRLVRRL